MQQLSSLKATLDLTQMLMMSYLKNQQVKSSSLKLEMKLALITVCNSHHLKQQYLKHTQTNTYPCSSHKTTNSGEPVDVGTQMSQPVSHAETKTHKTFFRANAAKKNKMLREAFKEKVLQSDKSVRKYTGFLSKNILNGIFKIIQKKVVKINYWKGPKQFNKKSKQSSRGKSKRSSVFDEFLITVIYIREAMEMEVLADLFGVSQSHVSCVITTWINILYDIFKRWLKYPTAENVRKNLPENYPSKYSDTRVILDCTEFFTVKPKNCTAQAATYSNYKHHNTVKLW
ncbi:hypothetical protein GWK47_045893 [Chionoecetes opilio]|uniref:Transposase Helix-turn-helix domain-containing protein n=1 Tax=Chionoecetes opilio TaxID=41210 RepID=A0A8J4Y6Q5_CHIOP|nr:hypothetical protein GWK47_045893 [Chionoecetes opilio]